MGVPQLVNVIASGLVLLSAARFMAIYNKVAPWRGSALGKVTMAITGAVGGFGFYTVLITLFPGGWVAEALRVGRTLLCLGIAVLLILQTQILLRVQKRDRSETDDQL
jgi:hypothetical protein